MPPVASGLEMGCARPSQHWKAPACALKGRCTPHSPLSATGDADPAGHRRLRFQATLQLISNLNCVFANTAKAN